MTQGYLSKAVGGEFYGHPSVPRSWSIILRRRKWGNGFPTLFLTLHYPTLNQPLLPLIHAWYLKYLSRTCPDFDHLFQPLEDAIRVKFIPALMGRDPPNDQVRDLLSLPPRHGGWGLTNPCSLSDSSYKASTAITLPLVNAILGKSNQSAYEIHCAQLNLISEYKRNRSVEIEHAIQALRDELPVDLQKQMEYASEKGASSWVSVLPIQGQNFHPHKSSFRDALCLRYGWEPPPSSIHLCMWQIFYHGA